jgi:hypothetical protein
MTALVCDRFASPLDHPFLPVEHLPSKVFFSVIWHVSVHLLSVSDSRRSFGEAATTFGAGVLGSIGTSKEP